MKVKEELEFEMEEVVVERVISSQYFSLYSFITEPLTKIHIHLENFFIPHRLEASGALAKMLNQTLLDESRSKATPAIYVIDNFSKE